MRRPVSTTKINTFSFGFRGGYGPQYRMECPDQHNEIELNFIEHGQMILQHGAKEVTVAAGEMVIYWAAVPHQVILAEQRTLIAWLSLPLSWFLSWNLSPALRQQILNGEVLSIAREADQQGARMLEWTRDLQKRSMELDKIVELELEVYFRRLALVYRKFKSPRILKTSSSALEKNQYGHVQKMVKFMTNHFRNSISVPQIADAAGLNPEYAMRLFRKCWGMTIGEFLLQQRISHAQRLLVLSEAKIVDIAFDCGFGSASRFYTAFRNQCHCTPIAYRRRPGRVLREASIDLHTE